MMSLRLYLALLCAGLGLPILAFVAVVLWRLAEVERLRLEQGALDTARSVAAAVDRELTGLRAGLRVLASSPALERRDWEAFRALAAEFREDEGFNIVLRAPDGQQLVNTRAPVGEPLPLYPLAEFDAEVLQAEGPLVSNAFRGRIANGFLFALETAVRPDGRGGEAAYLLGLSLPVERLREIMLEAAFPETWTVSIVDRDGTILARNRRHEAFAGRPATRDLLENTTGREGFWSGVTADGQPVVAAYARSEVSGWRVAVGVRRDELAAPLRRSLLYIGQLGAAVALASIALALLIGRRIAAAMATLAERAHALGRGEPVAPPRTPLREANEVGRELALASQALCEREALLGASEARMRALADNLPSGFIYQAVVEADGVGRRFAYVSQGCERITGVPAERALADPGALYGIIAPEHRAALARAETEAIAARDTLDVEAAFARDDGEVRWCRLISAPRLSGDGAADGSSVWDGLFIDVTHAKRAEEALRDLSERLEERVEAAVAEREATEGQLRQLQKMEAIGQLTGGVAHDFNNLLMAVLSSLEMLQKRLPDADPRTLRLIDTALQGARRGASLTQRLLAFARRQDLAPSAVDVPRAIRGMADLLRRTLGPGVTIELAFAADLSPALVDAHQLEMALLNLAVNARDAMPEGGTLRIEAAEAGAAEQEGLAPGRYLRVRLVDTGAGMDLETLGRAVEPFYTTKGVGKGTGLGLSMVQGLAEQSGGAFRLRSAPGRGTAAEILLPVAQEGVARQSAPGPAAPSEGPARPLRVLVVDDDALILMGTVGMLEDLGHEPIEAGSGEEALRLLGEREVDVVMTDQAMPRMTGVQLAERIRAERPHLPILLASGYADLPEGAGALIAARLGKPYGQDDLAAALARIVPR